MDKIKEEAIIVFGGTFNPPTIAHLHIATIAKDFTKAEKCIFLPVGDDYNKEGILHSKHRIHMLKQLFLEEDGFYIETYEVNANKTPTTYESLTYIKETYGKNNTYYFLMGSDNLEKISKWKNADDLLDEFYLLILKRADKNNDDIVNTDSFLKKYKSKIITLDIDNDFIQYTSSSLVRSKKTLEETRLLLDPYVFEYIKKYQLYDFDDYDAV